MLSRSYFGNSFFVSSFISQKVLVWKHKLDILADISVTQPHATNAAFTHGVIDRGNYLVSCIPDVGDLLHPLEEVIYYLI